MNYVSERFHDALFLASRIHEDQARKGSSIPYASHILGVAATVFKCQGSEDQAIAALLHDALEDHPDKITAAEIEKRFGKAVKDMVISCTDESLMMGNNTPWKERKQRYIENLENLSANEMLVVVADKLDNARDISRNIGQLGDKLWERFSGKKAGMIWYQYELGQAMDRWIKRPEAQENPYIKVLIEEFKETCAIFIPQGYKPQEFYKKAI